MAGIFTRIKYDEDCTNEKKIELNKNIDYNLSLDQVYNKKTCL